MVEQSGEDPINLDEEYKGDEMAEDAEFFDQNEKVDLFSDEVAAQFSVRNPQDHAGHIVYEVKGVDEQGAFDIKRRFNDFFTLHEQITKRWPGCIIPRMPAKQKFGNKDMVFIQERRYYLERFLRKLSTYGFIINGPEFQLFARPTGTGDVEKSLARLPKMTNQELYERMCKATGIDIDEYENNMQMQRSDTTITEFRGYIKKVDPFLKQLKVDLAKFLSNKQKVMQSYAGMAKLLGDYEDLNTVQYAELDVNQLVLNNPNNVDLKESMLHTIENIRNPFTDLYHWVKGELYDINAFMSAILLREKTAKKVTELKQKNKNTAKDIDSLKAGTKTVTTLFKNEGDVGNMQNKIVSRDTDIEYATKLGDLLTIYLGGAVLEEFKKEKMALYRRIIQQFHVVEISNSHQNASFWSQMLQQEHVKNSAGQEVDRM